MARYELRVTYDASSPEAAQWVATDALYLMRKHGPATTVDTAVLLDEDAVIADRYGECMPPEYMYEPS